MLILLKVIQLHSSGLGPRVCQLHIIDIFWTSFSLGNVNLAIVWFGNDKIPILSFFEIWNFNFQLSTFNFNVLFQISISIFSFNFQFPVSISSFNFQFKFPIWISNFIYQFQSSNINLNIKFHFHFWFIFQFISDSILV